jgi:hypothetical protein
MLSKLLSSARSLFNPESPTISHESLSVEIPIPPIEEMVTTRGQSEMLNSEHVARQETIMVKSPSLSKKRQRNTMNSKDGEGDNDEERGENYSSSLTKRQKQLPLREKDEPSSSQTSKMPIQNPLNSKTAENYTSLEEDEITAIADNSDAQEDESHDGSVISADVIELASPFSGTPAKTGLATVHMTTLEPTQSSLPKPSSTKTPSLAKLKQTKQSPHSAKTSEPEAKPTPSKHTRFGNEDPEPEIFSTAAEIPSSVPELDSSDDDEAPEVVTTTEASETAKAKARDAKKAAEE